MRLAKRKEWIIKMVKNDNYITLTEMADGFSEYNLRQSHDFLGKKLKLFKDDGMIIEYDFNNSKEMTYKIIEGENTILTKKVDYLTTSPRKNYYYLSYIDEKKNFVSVIIDYNRNIATFMLGELPTDETDKLPIFKRVMNDLPAYASKISYYHASIDEPFTEKTEKHEFSTDLVGHMATYSYSEKDAYLHIYHPNNLFTWACFSGNEVGLADTDYAKFLKLDDELYVIIWVEKILHVISTIILDFKRGRSTGAMASYEGKDYSGDVLMVPSGAVIKHLDEIDLSKLEPSKIKDISKN